MTGIKALKRWIKRLIQPKEERRHAMVGPAHLWEMKRDFQIQFLKAIGLKPGHYLFDIGCGTLRGGIPLISYLESGNYFGAEVRVEALEEGRRELREAGLDGEMPTLLLSPDIAQLAVNHKFDFIWAFSVLIHMSDEILNNTLDFVYKHLSDDGIFYANVNIGERKEANWQGFPVVGRTLEFYTQECAKNGLAVADIGAIKDHGHVSNVESQDAQRMLKITKNI